MRPWLAYAPAWFTTDADPDAPPAVIQLIASGELAVIKLRDGQVRTRLGRAPTRTSPWTDRPAPSSGCSPA